MTTQKPCPACQGTKWDTYPTHCQCANCGHMEPRQEQTGQAVIEQQYSDAGQHSESMRAGKVYR